MKIMGIIEKVLSLFLDRKSTTGEITPEEHQQDLKVKEKLQAKGFVITASDTEYRVLHNGLVLVDCLTNNEGGGLASHRRNLRAAIEAVKCFSRHRRKR